MALQVRRVVTGHDADGRAIVKIDEVSKHVFTGRPGATACNIWTTEGFPASNDGAADEGLRKVGTTLKNRGSAPCVLAVILIDAKSVEVGGKVLGAVG
ncbi:MAG TPA: hypothetical protein VJX71_03425 [Methylomirabilota bacterium]|nr:hypothetical protein [Methylomirabilota bacterium]